MKNRYNAGIIALILAIAVLTGLTAGAGIFLRGEGSFETVESVRGEHYEMAVDGIYAWNPLRLVAEGVGWDIFTLFFAVPALVLTVPALARGSFRGKLFAAGILSYLFYQYLMYATAWAFGPLFLPFIVIYGASFTAIILIVSTIHFAELPDRFSGRFPRKGMAVLCFLMGGLLVFMWLGRIIPAYGGAIEGLLIGQTTLVVQALDLGLIVPLAFITGILILRSKPAGYLLASVFVVKAFSMASAICAMLLSAWAYEGSLEVPPLIIFASAAAASLLLGLKMYRSVIPPATSTRI